MDPLLIGILILGVGMVLILIGTHIGVVLAGMGIVGVAILQNDLEAGIYLGSVTAWGVSSKSNFFVIPLFILMGTLAEASRFTHEIYEAARRWVGRFAGGSVMATTLGCAGFAAACGSTAATAAALGKVAIPEMKRLGVEDGLSAAVVAASGTLGIVIPPSIILVLYAILTEQSIGRMLIAGIIPGIVSALLYMVMIYTRVKLNPRLAPVSEKFSWRERFASLRDVWPLGLVVFAIFGGIYMGIWTPTEAAAGGATVIFIYAVLRRRLTFHQLHGSLIESLVTSVAIFIILIGAFMFARFAALSGLVEAILGFASGVPWMGPIVLLFFLSIMYFFLGMFLPGSSMLVLTMPLVFPLITSFGINPIVFGLIVTKMVEMAVITPPVGVNVYVIASVAPDIPVMKIFRATLPFLMMDVITLVVYIFFPIIITWLPSLMFG